jgi:hypothetical protein
MFETIRSTLLNEAIDPMGQFRSKERVVVELLRRPAGIEILNELVDIDPISLDRPGRVDYLSALEKQSAWLQELLQRAIVAVAGSEPTRADSMWSGVDDCEREEVASALRLSGGTAQLRIDVARTLTNHLPATCAALASGELSASHATVIARESAEMIRRGVKPEILASIESSIIAHAEFHTPAQVANRLRHLIAKSIPEEFEEIVAQATSCRKVTIYPESDGMATIVAFLPAQDAQTLMLAIDKLARISRNAIDPTSVAKTIDAFRADALTQIATGYLNSSLDDALNHRRPVTLNLTIDLATLLGMAENPGELSGYGVIPASVARELAADAKWRRFITDPMTGALLDFGRESYEPPQVLVDFLMARDQTCRFPGCRQPARIADIDHAQSWESGGETNLENLGLLCRRHHRLKTHGNWALKSFPDGSCQWTSPLGKSYSVPNRPIDSVA